MHYLGIDLGSSSIKLSVFNAESGSVEASIAVPGQEMNIQAPRAQWAEQNPEDWWKYVQDGLAKLKTKTDLKKIKSIGIAYQMHGLVLTDKDLNPLRPSIIWCDSRAAEIGDRYYQSIGEDFCQQNLLGSPANFTASKLKWVQENEPQVYEKAAHVMLPGDFIAAKFSGQAQISTSGLSEGMMWNFKENKLATELLAKMGLSKDLIPEVVPNFGHQARIHPSTAEQTGLSKETTITYRAGDQSNNAFSLNVTQPGEVATTAGTSAVIYSVTDTNAYDRKNRINTFLNSNNTSHKRRNGVMVCINGSGILYQWLRKILSSKNHITTYDQLNALAAQAEPGSQGLRFYPFGNGVERIFNNKEATSGLQNLQFNIHDKPDLLRSACEGIVFALNYGFDVMHQIGVSGKSVRAGKSNLFLSSVFREIFVNTTGTTLELYNTSGAEGAARGAAVGDRFYKNHQEAFENLECIEKINPDKETSAIYRDVYQNWKENLNVQS